MPITNLRIVQWFLWSCFFFIGGTHAVGQAQHPSPLCEPPPAVEQALRGLSAGETERQTFKQRTEQRLRRLRTILEQYPDDPFVHRRYQDVMQESLDGEPEPLMKQYRALLEKHPDDPKYLWLYGRLLIGRQTLEGRAQMEGALKRAPDFPWAHLSLVDVYRVPRYKDKQKTQTHLETFMRLCPSSLEAYHYLRKVDDRALLRSSAQKLRARLGSQTNADEMSYYNELWQLEFRSRPTSEHTQVRKQVEKDLKRLRQLKPVKSGSWLWTLRDGYKITSDTKGARWAEDQIISRFPHSSSAMRLTQERWRAENPYPKEDAPPEKVQAFHRTLLGATDQWIRRWPDDPFPWLERLGAVSGLKDVPVAEIEATADGLMNALEKNPISGSPPLPILMAEVYVKHDLRLQRIPELVQSGFREAEKLALRDAESDWAPPGEKNPAQENLKYTYWMGWPILVDAHLRMSEPANAREVLQQMEVHLAKDQPKDSATAAEKLNHARHQSTYVESTGRLAEAENRKLDALAYYQNALMTRPQQERREEKKRTDELVHKAQRLWRELGGTEQGWKVWSNRGADSNAVATELGAGTWEKQSRLLSDFQLADLRGRTWRLADLKGKVAFINIWATWCGPCHQELPYVQKLYERLKDRPDVVVLTLNIDTRLGLVEPYVKQKKFTFPVIPAYSYVEAALPVISIPRSWILDRDGVLMEELGFGRDGNAWLERALGMIQKAGSAK